MKSDLPTTKTAQKHAAVNGMGPFIVLFSSSALLGASISESDVTWFPFTLVIWLRTNKLCLKLNAEWTWLWPKCTHTSHTHTHKHTHTHIHACTPTHTGTPTYTHTLTKRLCPCWMFLAASGVETFQSGHMTYAHIPLHTKTHSNGYQHFKGWLKEVKDGGNEGREEWRQQGERRAKSGGNKGREEWRQQGKSDGSEGRVEWSQQGERRAKGGGNMGREEQRAEENTGREEWRIQGERSAKRQKEQTKRMKLVSGKEDTTLYINKINLLNTCFLV